MTKKRPIFTVLLLALGVLIIFLFVQSRRIDPDDHLKIAVAIGQLKENEALLNQDVLKLRFGLKLNYDGIVVISRKLAVISSELREGLLNGVLARVPAKIADTIGRYEESMQRRAHQIERFKARNAVFRNSRSYLSRILAEIARDVLHGENGEAQALHMDIAEFASVLLHDQWSSSVQMRDRVESVTAKISQRTTGLPPENRDLVDQLLRHAEIMLDAGTELESLVSQITDSGPAALTEALEKSYQSFYSQEQRTAEVYNIALFVVSAVLLAFISLAVLELARTTSSLKLATATLEEKVAERTTQLAEAKEAAESASRAKSDFLAAMSHEIRTPMNGILGMTDLLLESERTKEQREYLKILRHSGESLLAIVNDILDFSKIEAGKLEIEAVPFSPVEVIESVAHLLASRAHDKGLELAMFVRENVPSTMIGDPTRLRQIILNLIGNAVKFTERGGIYIEAASNPVSGDEYVLEISVRDTGIGIPEHAQTSLFERFTQADSSTTRRFGGTGLGLAICKQLVGMMGGDISVESRPGEGSEFRFHIQAKALFESLASADRKIRAALENCRVLVVDDNEINRYAFERQLNGLQMETVITRRASDAIEAVRKAETDGPPFDFVIVDEMMPEMSGTELVRTLREEFVLEKTHLVLSSSAGRVSSVDQARELGFDENLPKPIQLATLARRLGRLVESAATEETDRATPVIDPVPRAAPAPSGAPVLLVEDNKVNQLLATTLLSQAGYEIDVAWNGVEAIEAVQRKDYAVVLMDIQMPELDGFEASRRIRSLEGPVRDVPIIAMTANAMKGDRERCLDAGMDDYLSKPIDRATLLEKVANWAASAADVGPAPLGAESEKTSRTPQVDAAVLTETARRL